MGKLRIGDQVFEAPNRGAAVDMAIQAGALTPQQAEEMLTGSVTQPETGGKIDEFLIGAGKAYADRSFGLVDNAVDAPPGMAAGLGGAAPLVAASFLAGPSVAGQAFAASGLEAIREDSDPLSIMLQGGMGGAGAAAGQMAQRMISGISRVLANMGSGKPLTTTVQSFAGKQFARTVKGSGAFSRIDDFNQKLVNQAVGKALKVGPVRSITPEVIEQGAQNIGQLYDDVFRLLPDQVPMTQAAQIIDDIPAAVLPRKAKLLSLLNSGTKQAAKDADSLMRDLIPTLKSSNAAQWADELGQARKAIPFPDEAKALLAEANKRWNVLKSVEELSRNTMIRGGNVPASQLVGKFTRSGKKGLSGFTRGKSSGVSEVDDLANLISTLAADPVPIGSETFSRAAMFGPSALALGGFVSGQLDEEQALALAASGAIPTALGPAAFGKSLGALNVLAGSGAAAAGRELFDGVQLAE